MKAEKISLVIDQICKKLNIPYNSCNKDYHQFCEDAQKLGTIYLNLKVMAGELQEICERHKIEGIKNLLHNCITEIENVEHDLVNVAMKIKNEELLNKK
jgi:hypothetical protein